MSAETNADLLLLEPDRQAHRILSSLNGRRLQTQDDVRQAFSGWLKSVWVAANEHAIGLLAASLPGIPNKQDFRILVLDVVSSQTMDFLHVHFRRVVTRENNLAFLPTEELSEVLGAENSADLFIAGEVTPYGLMLIRGNLEPLIVSKDWFKPSTPGGTTPDFSQLSITDYGQTIKLGEFEAASDAILYEFDDKYRIRAKKRMRNEDTSLGGAIHRLRLQKQLRQSDFPGLSAKEISRIEKGVIRNPQEETLRIIAVTAGVPVDQLCTF